MRRNQITNAGLGYLTDLCGLRSLNLKATHVTDAGLVRYLPEMPRLQMLSLAYLDMSDDGLAALNSLEWLERINLRHTAISNDGIVNLLSAKSHTLRRLNLSNTVVNDAALAELPDQSQLQDLSLMDTGITDAGCSQISRYQWLTDLRLDLTDIGDDGVRCLANCRQLRNLDLFGTKITDTSPVWLSDTRIEHLGLGCTALTDIGIPALTEFSALRSLDLEATAITDKGLRYLSEASDLEQLFLSDTRISNAGIESLLKLPLKTLTLNLSINDAGLKVLSQHDTLQHLAVWNTDVTSWKPLASLERLRVLLVDDSVVDLLPLQSLRKLEYLLLWGECFPAPEIARLRLALPGCQVVSFAPHEAAKREFRSLSQGV